MSDTYNLTSGTKREFTTTECIFAKYNNVMTSTVKYKQPTLNFSLGL